MSDSFVPPKAVQSAARSGLALRKEHGRGGLSSQEAHKQGIGSGIVRAANLVSGKGVTLETVKRMNAYFSRHQGDKKGKGWAPGSEGYPSNGRIAWLLWGGDSGWAWAKRVIKEAEEQEGSPSHRTDAARADKAAQKASKTKKRIWVKDPRVKGGGYWRRLGAGSTSDDPGPENPGDPYWMVFFEGRNTSTVVKAGSRKEAVRRARAKKVAGRDQPVVAARRAEGADLKDIEQGKWVRTRASGTRVRGRAPADESPSKYRPQYKKDEAQVEEDIDAAREDAILQKKRIWVKNKKVKGGGYWRMQGFAPSEASKPKDRIRGVKPGQGAGRLASPGRATTSKRATAAKQTVGRHKVDRKHAKRTARIVSGAGVAVTGALLGTLAFAVKDAQVDTIKGDEVPPMQAPEGLYDSFQPGDLIYRGFQAEGGSMKAHYAVYVGKVDGEHRVFQVQTRDKSGTPGEFTLTPKFELGMSSIEEQERKAAADKKVITSYAKAKRLDGKEHGMDRVELDDLIKEFDGKEFKYGGFKENCESFARQVVGDLPVSVQKDKVHKITQEISAALLGAAAGKKAVRREQVGEWQKRYREKRAKSAT